jgi:SH3-like domain-containing protein
MIRKLGLGLVFLLIFTSTAHAEMVSISSDKARMRSGPGEKYPIKWELGVGYPLKVIGRQGNWIKVTDFESDTGWIYKKLVGKTPHLIVKNKETTLRKGPGKNQPVVGNATRGVVLRTLNRKPGWAQVRHATGLTGWVQRDTLWGW